MIKITVPGHKDVALAHRVLDFNGTLACDGRPTHGFKRGLQVLADRLQVYALTADTFGVAVSEFKGIPCEVSILADGEQDMGKLAHVKKLRSGVTVSVGNGRNDRMVLKETALGIAVVQAEGVALEALLAMGIVCAGIVSALDLPAKPKRLAATLRS